MAHLGQQIAREPMLSVRDTEHEFFELGEVAKTDRRAEAAVAPGGRDQPCELGATAAEFEDAGAVEPQALLDQLRLQPDVARGRRLDLHRASSVQRLALRAAVRAAELRC